MIPYLFLVIRKFIEESLEIEETGQTLVEYALILLLIAIVVIGAVTLVGGNLSNTMDLIANSIPNPNP